MRRPEQYHPGDALCDPIELPVGTGRYGAGIDVPGVRHDEGLGVGCGSRLAVCEQLSHRGGQSVGFTRIEHAGDGGGSRGHEAVRHHCVFTCLLLRTFLPLRPLPQC